ncbi:MAG: hypothetical protein ACLFP8_08720 [Alphaproteobacteria bacterium]
MAFEQLTDLFSALEELIILPVIHFLGNFLFHQHIQELIQFFGNLVFLAPQAGDRRLMVIFLGLVAFLQTIHNFCQNRVRHLKGAENIPDLLKDNLLIRPYLLAGISGITANQVDMLAFFNITGDFSARHSTGQKSAQDKGILCL